MRGGARLVFGGWIWCWLGGGLRDRLRLAAGVPLGLPCGVCEPADGGDHGGDGVGHVGEVDGADFVAGLVVVLVHAVAGDGVGDDALQGEGVVVGALEEELFGMGIVDEVGSVAGELGAEVGAVEAGEPEGAWGKGGVGRPIISNSRLAMMLARGTGGCWRKAWSP